MMLSRHEVESIADQAADKAVRRVLLAMGVDMNDPQAVLKSQKDAAFLRSWRESSDVVRGTSLRTAVAILVTGMLGLIGYWVHHGN